jgi:hypothetical protein
MKRLYLLQIYTLLVCAALCRADFPLTGSVEYTLWSKCATQEGEVQITGPDNCRDGGDGTGSITWNKTANKIKVCLHHASIPHDVMFARPQNAPWQKATNSYNRHLQDIGYDQFGPVNTHAQCLINSLDPIVNPLPIQLVYETKTGILVGELGNVGAAYDPSKHFLVPWNATVIIMDFPVFEAAPITPSNPKGRTTHCDTVRYDKIIDPVTGTAGGLALFVPYQYCRPTEIGTYYTPWGLDRDDAQSGDDLLTSMFLGTESGVGIAINVEPGFNPVRQDVHSWILSVGGGVGPGFATVDRHACGNYYGGFNITCQGSAVMPPEYPYGPEFSPPFIYEPTYVCNPATQTLNLTSCECINDFMIRSRL